MWVAQLVRLVGKALGKSHHFYYFLFASGTGGDNSDLHVMCRCHLMCWRMISTLCRLTLCIDQHQQCLNCSLWNQACLSLLWCSSFFAICFAWFYDVAALVNYNANTLNLFLYIYTLYRIPYYLVNNSKLLWVIIVVIIYCCNSVLPSKLDVVTSLRIK